MNYFKHLKGGFNEWAVVMIHQDIKIKPDKKVNSLLWKILNHATVSGYIWIKGTASEPEPLILGTSDFFIICFAIAYHA